MPGRGADRLVKSLRDHGSTVNELGGGEWKAQCPAHDDRTPSLSVTDTENRALFFCHAGCDGKDVLKVLG
jgi:DNA primase